MEYCTVIFYIFHGSVFVYNASFVTTLSRVGHQPKVLTTQITRPRDVNGNVPFALPFMMVLRFVFLLQMNNLSLVRVTRQLLLFLLLQCHSHFSCESDEAIEMPVKILLICHCTFYDVTSVLCVRAAV